MLIERRTTGGILVDNRLASKCEVKVMTSDHDEAHHGDKGEVWLRGPAVMNGYWRIAAATNEVLTKDGWLKTGDVTADNQIHIVDRKKVQYQESQDGNGHAAH